MCSDAKRTKDGFLRQTVRVPWFGFRGVGLGPCGSRSSKESLAWLKITGTEQAPPANRESAQNVGPNFE